MNRPILTRSNQALHLLELAAWIVLFAGFFFRLMWLSVMHAVVLAVCLVVVGFCGRRIFLEVEIRRVIHKAARRIGRDRALRRIRSRVAGI